MRANTVTMVDKYDTMIHKINMSKYEEAWIHLKEAARKITKDIHITTASKIERIREELDIFTRNEPKLIGHRIRYVAGNLDDKEASESVESLGKEEK